MATNRDGRRQGPVKDRSAADSTARDDVHLIRRRRPTDVAEVTDLILRKGLVVESFLRGAAFGLEIWTLDGQTTVSSLNPGPGLPRQQTGHRLALN